ncbi:MAG: UDP-N-acetylmuramate dehydrogenase [Lentilactobacillus diolivorans]|jgi:UDP-N-acetylmuramate dehydrogenase|uniref:UDP-N-acetylenolpyruvoylglucosamine reductase n=2 Tax=Lentilactobacillus diolivorans TaxID=179838 RepID=A0A0R1S698_9LACO|nr:UDP-N-acetylmuramate dehydrogenase [Lentilactobacillus diolivorans]RRG00562.1 MAG: UDP-N-acetylmuramate dehydrogenase [Lactobacillus sp.]KRL64487.1 UDP-N-acetylmuramate dehydrogenase [Lentilactobacillus diolivorans DSM 14421]MCH4165257.1 UDP-N-acetylmuramate dehydrogenase [Lentilactobacillus diolivorans]MDH5107196.1 UDP-N-acetylmuramate dehydrogenase [Lentilactobacillus diolivorans]GEP23017.1 UDP-N-acetylenolpyruvoylglucosamine reductase [Lentilactobacillus diolivorans]
MITDKTLLKAYPQIDILLNEPLSHYTNTLTGGPADILAFPTSVKQCQELVEYANDHQLPVTVIGNASNLIVKDGGIRGLTIILTKINKITSHENLVVADAGAALIDVTKAAQAHSLTGIEWAAGIPGSVGGAVFMNAGAYGGEIENVVVGAEVLTSDDKVIHLNHEQLDLGYRHSSVQENHQIVLSATFSLSTGIADKIQKEMDRLNFLRASKQPLDLPSCGSVFKRPKGYFAGKLIHDSGLQGFQVGGAQVSTKHAGFIVNVDHATATDYLNVISHVQETVYKKFGVHLHTEVRIIGDEILNK